MWLLYNASEFLSQLSISSLSSSPVLLGVGVAVLLDVGVSVVLDVSVAALLDVGVAVLDVGVAVPLDVGAIGVLPAEFTATTLMVYLVPLCSPVKL